MRISLLSPRSDHKSRGGFTIVEVMVVLILVAIMTVAIAPDLFRQIGGARDTTARQQVQLFGTALDNFRLDHGRFPTESEGLIVLWEEPEGDPDWDGPYVRRAIPNDPWGRPYIYRSPGSASRVGYDLISLGADGLPGGEGENEDINSWE